MARVAVSTGRLRARRRKRRALLGAAVVAAVLLVFGGIVSLSWAPFMRVTSVEVMGTKSIPAQDIQSYVQSELEGAYGYLFARNNIFLYPRAGIEAGLLAKYPTLRTADVHAKDFHTIDITVAERQPVALWCNQSAADCYYLDEEGLVYARAPQFSASPYVSYQGPATSTPQPGLKQFLTQDEFQSLVALVAALNAKEPSDQIGQVVVDANNDARAYFNDGFVLIFSLNDDGGDIFERFNLAIQSDAFSGKTLSDFQYLDLRFGDRLYYKLKSAGN
jgi:cell division septal protein FtsQ